MLKKIAVALAFGGMVAAVPAHAAGHFSLSLGLPLPPLPGVYVAPAPAYAPTYAPGYGSSYYGPPPVVYEAPVVYERPRPYPYGYYGGPRYYGPRVVYRGSYDRGGYREGYRDGHGWHR